MKIKIKDFQIIKKAEIEIQDVTVLVGGNNNGKSSIVRALSSALFNNPNKGLVRDGAKETTVEVSFDDVCISWKKGKRGGASFVVNGKEFKKLGRGVPVDLFHAFGIYELTSSKNKVRLNFWQDWEGPFLLNEPPSHLFEFFSQVRKEAVLLPVVRKMTSELGEERKECVRVEGAIEALQGRYDDLVVGRDKLDFIVDLFPLYQDIAYKTKNFYDVVGLFSSMELNRRALEGIEENIKGTKTFEKALKTLVDGITEKDDMIRGLSSLLSMVEVTEKELEGAKGATKKLKDISKEGKKFLSSVEGKAELAEELFSVGWFLNQVENDIVGLINKKKNTALDMDKVIEELGGVCPLCNNVMEKNYE